jgi:hypothetical protein
MENSKLAESSDLEQKYAFNTTRPSGVLGSREKDCSSGGGQGSGEDRGGGGGGRGWFVRRNSLSDPLVIYLFV